MLPELPEITRLRPRSAGGCLERFVEIERFGAFTLLAGLDAPDRLLDCVFAETRQREVDVGRRLEVGEEPGQERLIPGPRDLVQGEAEEARLFHGDIEPGDRDRGQP